MPPSYCRHSLELACAELPIFEIRIGRPNHLLEMQIVLPDDNETIRVGIRERRQENALDNTEHGGVGAYAEGESEHRHGGEAGGFTQQPQPIAQISPKCIHGSLHETLRIVSRCGPVTVLSSGAKRILNRKSLIR